MSGHLKSREKVACQGTLPLGLRVETAQQDRARLSRKNLWELLLFLLVSMGALLLQETDLHAQFSEGARQLLGMPLPTSLLSLALGLYGVSTVSLLLTRMQIDTAPAKRSFHLVFRNIFYLFYGFSAAMAPHYLFVFAIGLFLYGMEQLTLWLAAEGAAELEDEEEILHS